ncbi:MAG: hypothetical protein ABW046_20420 [Actinoplanes sp.]
MSMEQPPDETAIISMERPADETKAKPKGSAPVRTDRSPDDSTVQALELPPDETAILKLDRPIAPKAEPARASASVAPPKPAGSASVPAAKASASVAPPKPDRASGSASVGAPKTDKPDNAPPARASASVAPPKTDKPDNAPPVRASASASVAPPKASGAASVAASAKAGASASVAPPQAPGRATAPVIPGPVRSAPVRPNVAAAAKSAPVKPAAAPSEPDTAPAERRATRRLDGVGKAPWVLALSSLGVLLVAVAYAGGRYQTSYPIVIYWIGQVVVFTPVVVRLLSRRLAGSTEAFLLVIGLAVNQYLLKWMYSPDQFRFPDELQHWLATTIINESGSLFQPNTALPPAVHFPGLAEMGASVSQLTGLSVTASGLIVAGVLRLCFVGALFATVQRATRSPTIAGVTCVIYATALHYLFFNAMYLYAVAALPFLMLTVWATRQLWSGAGKQFALIAVVGIVMTTISHHVTAFVLVLTLLLLAAAELITKRPRPWSALLVPAFGLAVVVGWIAFVARDVIDYLEAPINQAMDTLSMFLADNAEAGSNAASVSFWQLGVQGAGLLCLFALYLAVTRDMLAQHDRDSWRWAVLIGGAVFFAGNGVRFLGTNGPEIAGRLTTFTYIPISVVGAYALVNVVQLFPARIEGKKRWRTPSPPPPPAGKLLTPRLIAGAVAVTVLMIGARVGGWPPSASLLPGPYVAAGFERSVDEYGIAAADWERTALGPDRRIGGDITAVNLSSTYGRQDPVREAAPLFYDEQWGAEDDELVASVGLEYLVVDRRITETLPVNQAYFDNDPHAGQITEPMSIAQISKFDTIPRMSRLYDNGNVRIYSLGNPS